jgi:peptidoglycan/xylan/chitin deacetylase (PgdA/CDA1 family)
MKVFRTPGFFKWIFPLRTWGFSVSDNQIFLTFDDGPDPEITPYVLDVLKEHDIKATFFCVGENVKQNPELFKRIKADGHAIGNHTMRHEKGINTNNEKFYQSIDHCATIVDSKLFRPPYGRATWKQCRAISKKHKIIMWSWLSYDYDNSVSIESILTSAESIRKGDILVLHDNGKVKERVQLLLPELITLLKKKGFTFSAINSA